MLVKEMKIIKHLSLFKILILANLISCALLLLWIMIVASNAVITIDVMKETDYIFNLKSIANSRDYVRGYLNIINNSFQTAKLIFVVIIWALFIQCLLLFTYLRAITGTKSSESRHSQNDP